MCLFYRALHFFSRSPQQQTPRRTSMVTELVGVQFGQRFKYDSKYEDCVCYRWTCVGKAVPKGLFKPFRIAVPHCWNQSAVRVWQTYLIKLKRYLLETDLCKVELGVMRRSRVCFGIFSFCRGLVTSSLPTGTNMSYQVVSKGYCCTVVYSFKALQ